MPTTQQLKKISTQLEAVETAAQDAKWFETERLAVQTLDQAIDAQAFDLAAAVCLPLQEARRQRAIQAIDAAEERITILDALDPEIESVDPGVYLLVPHAVGADARRLRLAGLQFEVPVLAVCREPETQMGTVPIVAIGATTVRAYVDPPGESEDDLFAWVIDAQVMLGNAALETAHDEPGSSQRIEDLRAALDSVPDHEGLQQALAETLRTAAS